MPLASCNICNRRFHGKFALRALAIHVRSHKNNHNNEATPPTQPHVYDLREAADIIWSGLSLAKRCSLLATFFIEQSHDTNPGGQHDNDTVDGEVISERRAG